MSDYIELNGERYRVAPEVADALISVQARIAKLEAALIEIRAHTYCKPGYRCQRCTDVQSMARKALEEGK